MAKDLKIEIKPITNGYIVIHANLKGDSWSDMIEMYFLTIEESNEYILKFYKEAEENSHKPSKR